MATFIARVNVLLYLLAKCIRLYKCVSYLDASVFEKAVEEEVIGLGVLQNNEPIIYNF